jgi:peptidoglycan/xylan/chitin deacetylase (PgdA/CDA1 family)
MVALTAVVLTGAALHSLAGGGPALAAPVPAAGQARPAPARPGAAGPASCPPPSATPVRRAPGTGRTVALTFDDGPSTWTPQVLEVLRRYQVKATFFVIGVNADRARQEVAAESAAGHLIGNHTWTHVTPAVGTGWPAGRLGSELDRTSALVRQITGAPTCWFRPPAGIVSGAAAPAAARDLSLVLWSVDSQDWLVEDRAHADPDGALARRIVTRATTAPGQDHPVVLMHDGGGYRGATVEALPAVIEYYRSQGYRFVRLDGR